MQRTGFVGVDCDSLDFTTIEGIGRFHCCFAKEQLAELHTYLNIMDDFISKSKQEEISKLNQKFESLPPGEYKDSFWPENYPMHWDEVLALNLRSSFIMLVISCLESYIKLLIRDMEVITNTKLVIKPKRKRTSIFEKARQYFITTLAFVTPESKQWNFVIDLYCLRCALVHNGGFITEKRVKALMHKTKGLSISSDGMLNIEKGFCELALTEAGKFVDSLYGSARIFYAGSAP